MQIYWNILGIEQTNDERAIKKAYAIRLKLHNPEEDAAGFMKLREAYDQALRFAKRVVQIDFFEEEFDENPIEPLDFSDEQNKENPIEPKIEPKIETFDEQLIFQQAYQQVYQQVYQQIYQYDKLCQIVYKQIYKKVMNEVLQEVFEQIFETAIKETDIEPSNDTELFEQPIETIPVQSDIQEITPYPPFVEMHFEPMQTLYDDFFSRINVDSWKAIFNSFSLHDYDIILKNAHIFFNKNCCLTHSIWTFLDSQLQLKSNENFKWKAYLEEKNALQYDFINDEPDFDFSNYVQLRQKAYDAFLQENYQQAVSIFEQLQPLPKKDLSFLKFIGDSYHSLRQRTLAIDIYSEYLLLLDDEKQDVKRMEWLADLLIFESRYYEAECIYQKLSKLNVDKAMVKKYLAICRYKQNKTTYFRYMWESKAAISMIIQTGFIVFAIIFVIVIIFLFFSSASF